MELYGFAMTDVMPYSYICNVLGEAMYSNSRKTMEEVQSTMTQPLQVLMEDRWVHEQSLVEEHEKREQKLQEKRHQYEERLARRDSEMKQQMELLKGLVEGLKIFGEPSSVSQIDRDRELKSPS